MKFRELFEKGNVGLGAVAAWHLTRNGKRLTQRGVMQPIDTASHPA